jgi:hypothetical protein
MVPSQIRDSLFFAICQMHWQLLAIEAKGHPESATQSNALYFVFRRVLVDRLRYAGRRH